VHAIRTILYIFTSESQAGKKCENLSAFDKVKGNGGTRFLTQYYSCVLIKVGQCYKEKENSDSKPGQMELA